MSLVLPATFFLKSFSFFFFLLFKKKIAYLAVLGLSCSSEIQPPDQGWNLGPVHWEFGVFALDHQGSPPAVFLLGGLDVTWDLGDPDVLCLVFPLLYFQDTDTAAEAGMSPGGAT